jgi:hypothetical protein
MVYALTSLPQAKAFCFDILKLVQFKQDKNPLHTPFFDEKRLYKKFSKRRSFSEIFTTKVCDEIVFRKWHGI